MPPPAGQPQAPPQMPAFQMPYMSTPTQQQQSAPPGSDQGSGDPYAAYGGQQAMYNWYLQQMQNMGQQPPNPSGGAPGTQ